jgi:monofunctional glycosyltransferase
MSREERPGGEHEPRFQEGALPPAGGGMPPPGGVRLPEGVAITPRGRKRRAGIRVLKGVLALLVGYYLLCLVLLGAYRFVSPPTTGVQAQRSVEALVTRRDYAKEQRRVPLRALPAHVPRAVVAAEDGGFWDHRGFDWAELRRARQEAAGGGRIRGASTITQQLMKNLFWTTHPNPVRKLYDFALTPPAELILGKSRILELYLNEVEWGDGVFGIEAAARHHYGVGAANLSRTQAAGLAALLPNPRGRTPANTGQYRAAILRRMGARGW